MANKIKIHIAVPYLILYTRFFGKQLMKERGKIEQQFSKLKDKGLEQPRWYDQNRYPLHVQLVSLIHNIAYLF